MDFTIFLLSAAIIVLLAIMGGVFIKEWKRKSLERSANKELKPENEDTHLNDELRTIIVKCEEKLPAEERNLVKILIEKDFPELPSILQIDDLKISLKRDHQNKSMFDVHNIIYAINLARCGHMRSARYVPTISEIKLILAHKDIINVYLRELGLETISSNDEFWCLDIPSDWDDSWKKFNWDLTTAYDKLKNKFVVLSPDGLIKEPSKYDAKLVLLQNGWDNIFQEV